MIGVRNWGYFMGYGNVGDGNSDFTGFFPPTNLANEYLEQYRSTTGAVRLGRITEVYAGSKICEVNCGDGSLPAIWCTEISHINGAGTFTMPSPGDYALIWKPVTGYAVVIGCLPELGDPYGINMDINHLEIDAYTESRHSFQMNPDNLILPYYNSGRPTDILPGDIGWVGPYGEVIGILQGYVQLRATPLAQIQCLALDDLVRIVARTYEFRNAGGETRIFNDEGEVNHEYMFTHKGSEALGETAEGKDISKENTDGTKLFQELENSEQKAVGRIQLDVGHNGDIIHLWIRKAQSPEGSSSAAEGIPLVGLAHIRIGTDGALLVETTKECLIAKTDKVLTPNRSKEAWDKTGDSKDKDYEPDKNQKQTDFMWDKDKLDGRALQEEDQQLYNRRRNVRKYKDHKKDFGQIIDEMPREEDNEEKYTDAQALIHLRSDGSIYLQDEARSSVELTGQGDVRFAVQKDILVEAGRDITLLAGRSIHTRSKKHAEVTCSEGDVRIKAKGSTLIRTEDKGILIETASKAPSEKDYNGKKGEEQTSGGIVLRSLEEAPIALRSAKEKIIMHSEKDIDIKVDNEDSKFYVEAPHAFFNLLTGIAQFSVKCKRIIEQASSAIEQVTLILKQRILGFWISDTTSFAISGRSTGFIHAPGPGVDIAHTHSQGLDTFSFQPDAHGEKIAVIQHTNAAKPAVPKTPEDTTFEDEVDPHTPPTLDKFKFNYLEDYGLDGCFWYETVWQREAQDADTWDLTKDKIDETEPYPGKKFKDRYTYKLINKPKDEDPKSEAAQFTKLTKESYKIGPQSCKPPTGAATTTI